MSKLDHVGTRELQAALERVDSAKAAKRLVVALAYKDGVHVGEIERRYGIPQSTIYYWLSRFEEKSLADALEDEPRPGRPPKLDSEQRAQVESWLEAEPESDEAEPTAWTAERLRERIEEEFGVQYSEAHVGRVFLE